MPLALPELDNRRFEDLRAEALARIPVHTPEWTNFNRSDPGITLLEVFAYLAETVLYTANRVPERNRLRFLDLLGQTLRPASAATGIIAFTNDKAALDLPPLPVGTELTAGQVGFRTTQGVDVLPVEARIFAKRAMADTSADPELKGYYEQLYAAFNLPALGDVSLYETVAMPPEGIDLGTETIDRSLWIALLTRASDRGPDAVAAARSALAGRTLTLGFVPIAEAAERRMGPAAPALQPEPILEAPQPGPLSADRQPRYRRIPLRLDGDVLQAPGTAQAVLPGDLSDFEGLEPLESGTGQFPPPLEDTALAARLIGWLRLRAPAGVAMRLLWVGINAVMVEQRTRIQGEALPSGTGEPGQVVALAHKPVLAGSVRLTVNGRSWSATDDLAAAGSEVPGEDPRLAPGAVTSRPQAPSQVFMLDAEAGLLRFGDGATGARPPPRAAMRADYDVTEGREGNVGPGRIDRGATLPLGITVTNPVRSWGGADAETTADGEAQVTRFLQHRDRCVTAADFATIALRAPSLEIGRVEVLAAYSPELGAAQPGDAAGAVTLMVIPRPDPAKPGPPLPNGAFLDALCHWLEPRRLVTTELFLRGPAYRGIWISVGIEVEPGRSIAEVRSAVEAALRNSLAPLAGGLAVPEAAIPAPGAVITAPAQRNGWPLRKPVLRLELATIAARVEGVAFVRGLELLAEDGGGTGEEVPMAGLQLPWIIGLSVTAGEAVPITELRGRTPPPETTSGITSLPVPVVPERC